MGPSIQGPGGKLEVKREMRQCPGLRRWHFKRSRRAISKAQGRPSRVHPVAWVWKDLTEFEIAARTFTVESCKKPREPSGAGLDREKA